jgi:phosphopantothenoylcysteine decarboxylase / phosphopantothenate---cysteine ligase
MKKENKVNVGHRNRLKDRDVQLKSNALRGKKIAVAICGGIACVETVKIIREIRRYGATVTAFYTPDVRKFMTEVPAEWASGQKVITEAEAQVEHLETYDGVLVVPATWNTMAKSALGIADNVVTLLIASHLGKKGRLLFVPAMNSSLQSHPLFETYKATLQTWGAQFLLPELEEDRLKISGPVLIAETLLQVLKEKR